MTRSAKKHGWLAAGTLGAVAACNGMTEQYYDNVAQPLILWNSDSTSPIAAGDTRAHGCTRQPGLPNTLLRV